MLFGAGAESSCSQNVNSVIINCQVPKMSTSTFHFCKDYHAEHNLKTLNLNISNLDKIHDVIA